MSSLNQVNIIGRVGKDPEVRTLGSGGASVTSLSIATTEKWKDKQTGEPVEQTEWHRVSFFGKLAEIVGEYVRKGSLVFVSGSIHTRKWTDKDNIERFATEIKASEMKMLGGKSDAAAGGGERRAAPAASPQRPPAPVSSAMGEDDLPF